MKVRNTAYVNVEVSYEIIEEIIFFIIRIYSSEPILD